MINIDYARRCFQQGDASHWRVALMAYRAKGRLRRELAEAIGCSPDTVENLAAAYSLFRELLLSDKTSEPIRKLRRQFPYTRWAVVYRQWMSFEFDLSEAKDWLENFSGGNKALSAEIENKHGAPEWERRAYGLYKNACKLSTDFGVPDKLAYAAKNYADEYDTVFPKVKQR